MCPVAARCSSMFAEFDARKKNAIENAPVGSCVSCARCTAQHLQATDTGTGMREWLLPVWEQQAKLGAAEAIEATGKPRLAVNSALFWVALGAVVIAVLSLALTGLLLVVLKKTIGIRSKEADEFDGLDLAEHDLNAYPDFQQTTIKSYHLREA